MKCKGKPLVIISLLVLSYIIPSNVQSVVASGLPCRTTAGDFCGQGEILSVPINWCGVRGSPAVTGPSVPSVWNPSVQVTDTDHVIRDRHLRAGINIWLPQSGIIVQTNLPNPNWPPGATNTPITGLTGDPSIHKIPIIRNPSGMPGGNIHAPLSERSAGGGSVFVGTIGEGGDGRNHYNTLVHDCESSWESHPRFFWNVNSGLIAVNIGQFVFAERDLTVANLVAYGGCSIDLRSIFGTGCKDGNFLVRDNRFTLTDGIQISPTSTALVRDPSDIATAAGIGWALGAFNPVVTVPGALFHGSLDEIWLLGDARWNVLRDSDGNGIADNTRLRSEYIDKARFTARNVPNVIIDPPNTLVPGDVVSTYKTDKIEERNYRDRTQTIPQYLDISKIAVELNRTDDKVSISQKLFGLIPNQTGATNNATIQGLLKQYYTFLNTDNSTETGAQAELLQQQFGLPPDIRFNGTDLVIASVVDGKPENIRGLVYQYQNERFVPLPTNNVQFTVYRQFVFPVLAGSDSNINATSPEHQNNLSNVTNYSNYTNLVVPMNDMVDVTIDNKLANVTLNKAFSIQAITSVSMANNSIIEPMTKVIDKLDETEEGNGITLELREPNLKYAGIEMEPLMTNTNQSDLAKD